MSEQRVGVTLEGLRLLTGLATENGTLEKMIPVLMDFAESAVTEVSLLREQNEAQERVIKLDEEAIRKLQQKISDYGEADMAWTRKEDITERLLDSEEHATDEAIPQVAYDAVEEIQLLRQQLKDKS